MDSQLKGFFAKFHNQFGTGPGLGPSTGTNLLKIPDLSAPFIKSLYKTLAALYRTDPWKKLRPNNLLGFRIGKDSDWSVKRQIYPCAQFIGGNGGDLGIYLFKSEQDGLKVMSLMETKLVANIEILRVVFEKEELLVGCNKRMVSQLSLEGSGNEKGFRVFPIVDVAMCDSKGGIRFRDTSFEELRYLYAFIKAITLVHPLLHINENEIGKNGGNFEAFIETVDVDFPAELAGETVAVTISFPPNQTYDEKKSISEFSNLNLNSSSIKYLEPPKEEEEFLVVRKCELCEKLIQFDQSLSCARCKSVIYCGPTCQKNHWKDAHKNLCTLYKSMMEREEELILKMFKFNLIVENPCKWLESIGLHKKGMWRRICACFNHYPFGLLPKNNNNNNLELWGGLDERETPSNNKTGNSNPVLLSSWNEYYNIRSLPLSSPVSIILSYPLTIYYILTTLVVSTKNRLIKGKDVILHYLGPTVELDWLQIFCEITHLLNGSGNLQIYMIGPEIPNNLIGLVPNLTNKLRVKLVRGLYQDQIAKLPSPNLVIGLNCDFESHASWVGAIGVVKEINVPAFFTEKSEILCGNAKKVLRKNGLNLSYPVGPNPFRSPLREKMASNNLPCFSNGFIFGVNT